MPMAGMYPSAGLNAFMEKTNGLGAGKTLWGRSSQEKGKDFKGKEGQSLGKEGKERNAIEKIYADTTFGKI